MSYVSPLLDNQFTRSLSSFARNFNNWIKFDSLLPSALIAIPCLARYCKDSMIFVNQRRLSSFVARAVVLVISKFDSLTSSAVLNSDPLPCEVLQGLYDFR